MLGIAKCLQHEAASSSFDRLLIGNVKWTKLIMQLTKEDIIQQ
jgi:hypothetical protein